MALHVAARPSAAASVMYGIGLGGFVDGIVLHQLLQWHHMVSASPRYPVATVAGLEANTLADGFFHVFAWLVVVGASVVTLAQWRQGRLPPSARLHVGGLLAGWGGFNLAEGVVDHQLLGVHLVRDDLGGPVAWDLGFLAVGLALLAAGWVLVRAGAHALDDIGWTPAPGPAAAVGSPGGRELHAAGYWSPMTTELTDDDVVAESALQLWAAAQTDFDPFEVPSEDWPSTAVPVRDADIAVDTHLDLDDVRAALHRLDGVRVVVGRDAGTLSVLRMLPEDVPL